MMRLILFLEALMDVQSKIKELSKDRRYVSQRSLERCARKRHFEISTEGFFQGFFLVIQK